ncbi:MAG: hypothetical protein LBD01_02845 [Puniceicoccales bacterium]|nr:hypothetical protein [Puniceicoccales bacterium]
MSNDDLPALPSLPPSTEFVRQDVFLAQPLLVGAPPSRWQRFWRKFGGDGFLISVAFHVALIIIALTVAVSTVVTVSKNPESIVTGGGGGNGGEKISMTEHRIKPKNARNMAKTPSRLVAKGASAISIPDMPNMNNMFADSTSLLGVASKGIGGGGGGGEGGGIGPGVGGGRNLVSLFGTRGFKRPNALEGTLYDLKRDASGKELYPFGDRSKRIAEMRNAYLGFIKGGMDKSYFDSKYTSTPNKLYATHMLIPPVDASMATQAFGCEKEIQAPGWLGYYEGWITPPESGSYRFAGMGDDGLLIVFNGQPVLWAPWTQGGMQTWVKAEKDWEPKRAYEPKGGLPNLNTDGRYYGSWIEMSKGQRYKIQIVIAEGYGGLFSASALLQDKRKHPGKNPPTNIALPPFMLAPLNDEEKTLKKGMRMKWTPEGPYFGLEINGLKPSGVPTRRSRR